MLQTYIDKWNKEIIAKHSDNLTPPDLEDEDEPEKVCRCTWCGKWIKSDEYWFEIRGTKLHKNHCLAAFILESKVDRADGKKDNFDGIEVIE